VATTRDSSPTSATARRAALHKLPLAALGLWTTGLLTARAAEAGTRQPGRAGTGRTATTAESLNLALTLEYLQDELYRQGLAAARLIPAQDRRVFRQISKQEGDHVSALKSLLGGAATPKPTIDLTHGGVLPDVLTNYASFLGLAQALEDMGSRACKGQLPSLRTDGAALATLVGIHSVEARHAAVVRRIRGENSWITGIETEVPVAGPLIPVYAGEDNHVQDGVDVGLEDAATEAFDEPMTRDQALAITSLFVTP